MIDLAGGDLASKRQAKSRFLRNYEHRVEPYCASRHLADCRRLLEQWKSYQDAGHAGAPGEGGADAGGAKRLKEATATDLCLESAEQLGLKGMVVYVKDGGGEERTSGAGEAGAAADGFRLRGFTFGEYVGRDQSSITIEKTDLTVKGLAQFIFSEFCRTCWSDRPLVNVGDDWGLETLAWTKMSYRPVKLLQKYVVRKRATVSVAAGVAPELPARSVTDGATEVVEPVRLAQPGELLASADVADLALLTESLDAGSIRPGSMQPMPRLQGTTPLPVAVRVADKKDVPAAVELERACFSPSVSLKKRQLEYLRQRRSAVFLVAEQGGVLVGEGIALLRRYKAGTSGRIYSLAVDGRSRGQRIGDHLLSAMLATLAQHGARRVYLEVERGNAAALRLYERHGFRRIGTLPDYYGPGKEGIHMMTEVPEPQTTRRPLKRADRREP
jgi:ribosomal protein S18 acetylase RimI-like enzyme